MKRNVSVVCVCSGPNCYDTEQRSASNILISGKIIKEMPGSVASGTLCIMLLKLRVHQDIQSLEEINLWLL